VFDEPEIREIAEAILKRRSTYHKPPDHVDAIRVERKRAKAARRINRA